MDDSGTAKSITKYGYPKIVTTYRLGRLFEDHSLVKAVTNTLPARGPIGMPIGGNLWACEARLWGFFRIVHDMALNNGFGDLAFILEGMTGPNDHVTLFADIERA